MNSMTLKPMTLKPIAVDAPLPGRRVLGAYLAETRYEFMRSLRNPAFALPMMLIPAALYLLFAVFIAGEAIDKDPPLGVFLFAGFAVMAVSMPALFGIGTSLALERDMGLMRLKRAQPAPTGTWLVAKIVCGLIFSVMSYLPMLAIGLASGKLDLGFGQAVAMSAALLAGSIPFCALGLMVGTLVSGSAAPGYANLIYLPGCYLSGMFFPLPKSMHWQTPIWPQFHIDQLAMHAAGITKYQFIPAQLSIGALVGFTVLFSAVAIWRLARKG
ncbi:MAG TPA: ABC transporter permease [Steroidobacteraceae bacterium]|nr:ABC transporter permease [Steroidobacteraceae bacterium]